MPADPSDDPSALGIPPGAFPRLLLGAALLVGSGSPASAGACPAFLASTRKLLVVTVPGMDASRARLRLFERDALGEPWRARAESEPAVIGAGGLAWGDPFRDLARPGESVKVEGDRRTPAGIYRIGPSFGFSASARPGHRVLPRSPGGERVICVDDPASPAYNTLATRASLGERVRGEDMGAEPLYRSGLVIDYPSDAGRRAGSCIFLHVWRGPGAGTAGCVALQEARVAALQDFATPGASAIAILPAGALDRFRDCLPPVTGD